MVNSIKIGNFLFLGSKMKLSFFLLIILILPLHAFGAGKTYESSNESHCTEWSNKLLKWPQTSLGSEKAKCRIRAKKYSTGPVTCRLKRSYVDKETGSRMCVYYRQGYKTTDKVVSISRQLKCQVQYECKRF